MAPITALHGQDVHLTDARGVGVMLRDTRLTLRGFASLSQFRVEPEGEGTIVLRALDYTKEVYVGAGAHGAYMANYSRRDAKRFTIEDNGAGPELYQDGRRPAIFDYFYDVSIGQWQSGRSSIPVLLHVGLPQIWKGGSNFSSIPQLAEAPPGALNTPGGLGGGSGFKP